MDMDAELIALAYRFRWQIELFSAVEMHLGLPALVEYVSERRGNPGLLALIASLLIAVWVGRKPTKRTYEMLCSTSWE